MIRKYLSEFGLNMRGEYNVLLQQGQLDKFSNSKINRNYPSHIYMITRHPRIALDKESIEINESLIEGKFKIQKQDNFESKNFKFLNSSKSKIVRLESNYPYTECTFFDAEDKPIFTGKVALLMSQLIPDFQLELEILYIGQSFGNDGSRTASQRLVEHSTLQEIYFDNINKAPDKEIWIVLWNFEPMLVMSFDGTANTYGTSMDEDSAHMSTILNSEISNQQKINFTEAALIRYFQPEYNDKFKFNFPTPAHITYSECYDLDLNSVNVEIETDNLKCLLWSPKISPEYLHIISFPLHSAQERKAMFDIEFKNR